MQGTMLKGKTALITGSTSGIGLGIAKSFAAQGSNIVFNGFGDAREVEALQLEVQKTQMELDLEKQKAQAEMQLETFKQGHQMDMENRRLQHESQMKQKQVEGDLKVKALSAGV